MYDRVSNLFHLISQRTLSREIAAALLIKLVLLWGLWYVAFRYDGDKPVTKPNIADLFRYTKASMPPHNFIRS